MDTIKKQKNGKYKLPVIFLIVFIVISLSEGIFFVISTQQKEYDIKVDFLDVNQAIADSLLEELTIDQKINLLLVSDSSNFNEKIAGYFVSSQSNEAIKSYKKISDTTILSPFFALYPNSIFPKFNEQNFIVPNQKTILSIADTNILTEYINLAFEIDSLSGQNFKIIQFCSNINEKIIKDSSIMKFYSDLCRKTIYRYSRQNFIIAIKLADFYFPNDSTKTKKFSSFYKNILSLGANTLIISSKKQLDGLNYLSFNGLIIAQKNIFSDLKMFIESDADMILTNDSIETIKQQLINIVISKNKYKKLIDKKVKKILLAQTWITEDKHPPNIDELKKLISSNQTETTIRKIYKNSIVLLRNSDNFLPIKNINSTISCLIFTDTNKFSDFQNIIKKYNNTQFQIHNKTSLDFIKKITKNKNKNYIIILDNLEIDTLTVNFIKTADTLNNIIVVNIGNCRNLEKLQNLKHLYFINQLNKYTENYLAQAIFGGIQVKGQLNSFCSDSLAFGSGIQTAKTRLGYDIAEMAGLDSAKLSIIDSIALSGIKIGAYPGCQVFVAKNGIIVWDKSYGRLSYSQGKRVTHNTLYDIASVTKIAATTLAAMKMVETGKLYLDDPIGKYYKNTNIEYDRIKPDTIVMIDTLNILEEKDWEKKIKNSDTTWIDDTLLQLVDTVIYKLTPKNNIFKVTPRQLLMHMSGIQPAMPILKLMLLDDAEFKRIKDIFDENDTTNTNFDKAALRKMIYSDHYIKDSAERRVAQGMFLKNAYADTLWRDTKALPVMSNKKYVYSDVNMILLQQTIDTINNYSISKYVQNNFYKPLGIKYITYKPLKKFDKNNIAPTENDRYWRMQVIRGDVHDPSAALLGGIAGNAGIFSNAYSLGVIGQMLLNGGTYGDTRFLSQATIAMFTQTQPDSYRGLGFDKWAKRQIIAPKASPNTYGHTGFTGTCMWIDPDNEVVFVFLSNRVHPSVKNWKLNSYKIRNNIHQAIYNATIR